MLIAQQKLNENIAEYVLYMFQLETFIRAVDFDVDTLVSQLYPDGFQNSELENKSRAWYKNLAKQMISERIEKSGHLMEVMEIIVELSYLHNTLMTVSNDEKYKEIIVKAQPFLREFREKSNFKEKNDIELAFHALYMKLLLKLQRKEISSSSEEAFEAMSKMLAYLSLVYKKMKSGDMNFLKN